MKDKIKYSRVYAEIDLDYMLFNLEAMHGNLPSDTKMMAVIKTDGYGHGAVEIAALLEEIDYVFGYGVATVEEAFILRRHGIKKPILILGYVFPDQYEEVIAADIRPCVFTLEMAKELSEVAQQLKKDCLFHFAVDTGMSRIGYQVTEESVMEMMQIAQLPHMMVEGIFTHFARADELKKTSVNRQLQLFSQMIEMLEAKGLSIPIKHCSNSAGIVELIGSNYNMVRAGITLYGLWPSKEVRRDIIDLKPVLSLKTHVAYVKTLEPGREISYGGTYTTQKEERIATIPVGYGDGYARSLSNCGYVLIHGEKAPIRGRVCMDQFMVDVTEIPDTKIGDEVTLIGTDGEYQITAEELGELSGRFNYEFVCDLGKRIPRVFYHQGKIVGTKDYFSE